MTTALIESHYFPSLEYFCAVLPFENIVLEQYEHYVKQSPRNRCFINTAQGVQMLTVPVEKKSGKVFLKDVKVEAGSRWRNNHWRSIQSAYAKSPFFEHYSDDVHDIINHSSEWLHELGVANLSFCLRSLGKTKGISESEFYEKPAGPLVSDFRSLFDGKSQGRPAGYYQPVPYYQVFGNSFASNLSLLDLLFCEGPNAAAVLSASVIGN